MALKLPLVINSGELQQLQSTDACGLTVVNDTTTNATMFPLWVTANTGYLQAKVTSTKLTFNPSTGAFSSTQFLATNSVGIGTATPNFILSFGTALFSGGSKLALYENAGADVYGFGVTSGSVDFYAGGTQVAAFRNGSGGLYSSLYRLTIGSANFTATPPVEGVLIQGGLMLGASGDPGAKNIGIASISAIPLVSSQNGILFGIGSLLSIGSADTYLQNNLLTTTGGVDKYLTTDGASRYRQAGGGHIFHCCPSGTGGTTVSTFVTSLTIGPTRISAGIPFQKKSYSVATLPAGVTGDTALVTDALTPTFGATVVGGGAVKIPVYSDGTNWKVG